MMNHLKPSLSLLYYPHALDPHEARDCLLCPVSANRLQEGGRAPGAPGNPGVGD